MSIAARCKKAGEGVQPILVVVISNLVVIKRTVFWYVGYICWRHMRGMYRYHSGDYNLSGDIVEYAASVMYNRSTD